MLKTINKKSPIVIVLITVIVMIFNYYSAVLLHEYGHGTVAWLFGAKDSPFDIYYGNWYLQHVDENVDYKHLVETGQGVAAALIGIAGVSVSFSLVLISLSLVAQPWIQKNTLLFLFSYWGVIFNMVAVCQYIPVNTFIVGGDIGWFVHGLGISPWWIFFIGTPLVIALLWRILAVEVPKAYKVIPIESIFGRNIFLLTSLSVIFLLLYALGYNPFAIADNPLLVKILAAIELLMVPILFFVCRPSRKWTETTRKVG